MSFQDSAAEYRNTATYDNVAGYQQSGYQGSAYQDDAFQGGAYQGSGFGDNTAYTNDGGYQGYDEGMLAGSDLGLGTGAGTEDTAPRKIGMLAGAITGFLAAGVAIGIAMLAAAFVRPQASPVIAVGGWFIDHTPPSLKEFAVQNFGENDKTVLLASMYTVIGILAIIIGLLSRRRAIIGAIGIAAFGIFGAYIAATRPDSRMTDVIPALVGGVTGVGALLLLARSAAPARWAA